MIVPSILAGGFGSRLWPLSRRDRPKQFLKLFESRSLFQMTCERVSGKKFFPPLIVCNEDHRFVAAEQLAECGISPTEIVLEPIGRNTAASAILASLIAQQLNSDALVLLLPSDHLISNQNELTELVEQAASKAKDGSIVTFGITPDKPHTGYGYLKLGNKLGSVWKVDKFIEKPVESTAKRFIASPNYVWNSGIFLFSAKSMIQTYRKFAPSILKGVENSLRKSEHDLDFLRLGKAAFSGVQNISFDFAIMEKCKDIACIKANLKWNDLGSWSSVWETLNRDEHENAAVGKMHILDGSRNLGISEGAPIFVLGLDDIIVINTHDAILVANRNKEQRVREIVNSLNRNNRPETIKGRRNYKPWGWTEQIIHSENYIVNLMHISPGGSLSKQSHMQRTEHWVLVSGELKVSIGRKQLKLEIDQSTFVEKGVMHELQNTGHSPARIIEIQTGIYFGEDDIHRIEN